MPAASTESSHIIRQRPILFMASLIRAILSGHKTQTRRLVQPQPNEVREKNGETFALLDGKSIGCKWGEVGDRLWVRERWAMSGNNQILYAADSDAPPGTIWRPPYHMPRSASRILLQITSCRLEPLQQISRADAQAEGLINDGLFDDPREWFMQLWDRLSPAAGCAWRDNPWVWVIQFKMITPPAPAAVRQAAPAPAVRAPRSGRRDR